MNHNSYKKLNTINVLKRHILVLCDFIIFFLSGILSQFIVKGNVVFEESNTYVITYFIVMGIFFVLCNLVLRLYNIIPKYADFTVLIRIVASTILITIVQVIFLVFTNKFNLGFRWLFTDALILICLMVISRFYFRVYESYKMYLSKKKESNTAPKVMIIGAESVGLMILKELAESKYVSYQAVCVIDDDIKKQNTYLYNVPIVGTRLDIIKSCKEYSVDTIILALPSISAKERKEILDICKLTSCKIKTVPGMYEMINGTVNVSQIRDVKVEELLGRDQVVVNMDEITSFVSGKVVLVTGGGGSIGSELCRQLESHKVKQLIILDIYENNAYDIEQELLRHYPNINLVTLIASIRDFHKLETIFIKYKPEIVFNAAAHKHVPLMETSPCEAIKNNVFGTYNIAKLCDMYHVLKLVQISTDKAVNPTNIMGASKRLCEMIIQGYQRKSKCDMVAVRFGNVLGSNGSVIPLFKKQIAEGGPVTVTHKDINRFFMTIPEAVSLILEAGSFAKGGEIFVLDMGEPVKIYDLAYNLIKLAGYIPNQDIEIKITGLRPGEKLYEERLMDEEGLSKTPNGLINICKPLEFDEDKFFSSLDSLYAEAYKESDDMKNIVASLVPTYKPDNKK